MNKPNLTRKAAEQRRRARVRRQTRLAKKRAHINSGSWSGAVYFEAWDQASLIGNNAAWRSYWLSAVHTVLAEHPEAELTGGMRSAGGYKGVNEEYPHLFKEPGNLMELDEWDNEGHVRAARVSYQMVQAARHEWEQEYGHRDKPKATEATQTTVAEE